MPRKKHFRFLATAILAALMVTLAVALPGVSADGDEDKNREMDQSEEQALSIPEKAELKYPNLGSHLDGLVVQVEDGETTSQGAALDTPVHSGASVAVTIHLTGNVDDVVTFLEENGGDPRNVGEDYIEAYVPVSLLGQLSKQPGVIRVREIVPPQPAQLTQRITGHGPPVHGSQAWNQAGYSGQGVKVGIIDTGFTGFSSLMETELPTTVVARCYTDVGVFTQDLADCEAAPNVTDVRPPQCLDYVRRRVASGDSHGTIVAESLIDIAPGVELYIANPYSLGDLQATAAWMASQGVSVINHSVGWFFDGPGDGTSPISASALNTVDRAVASDVTWVNAAGNRADDTWFGDYSDPDGDRALRFGGQNNEIMGMFVGACQFYRIQLRWEDNWDGASTDLDLHLADRITGDILFSSDATQSGESGHVPLEWIRFRFAIETRGLGIAVTHPSGEAPDWVQITVWGPGGIQHYTKNGSIGNPAESANRGMLAVGATHWNDVRAIEPYSSRGPTPDGRDKPDIVGADCGATALSPLNEYNEGFCGTSQASPHVAGMAVLVRQRFPDYTPAQVASYLKDNAEQRQSPDPNDTWGHGFAKLPPPDGAPPATPAPPYAFTWNPAVDFNTLTAAGNTWPQGIWSDGETMWVVDFIEEKIYAYDLATKARVPGKDFDTLKAAGNAWPQGIWSDGTTMWAADFIEEKIYAYDLATKARVPDKDFDTLKAAGNTSPQGIWSDGTTMWAADFIEEKIYAYDLATKARVPDKDFDTLKAAGNTWPQGIWSDSTTMWVADSNYDKVYAYDMATKARVPAREFNTLEAAGNWIPRGIWSDGTTMWAADSQDAKIYSYLMPQAVSPDRATLVALYNATGGANWTNNTNWLTNAPIGQWHGVTTDANGRVTKLYLQENVLSGQIPTELGSLSNLENLVLWGNELTGTIPTKLGSLANLELLSVSDNQLTGTIPTELGSLVKLKGLRLSENQLTGQIPTELGSLSNLENLVLWGNELTGEIPQTLVGLIMLESFSFYNNLGLCAPVDDAFQTWLRGISIVYGSSCAPADSPEDRAVLVQVHSATDGANWTNNTNWLSDEHSIREWYGVTIDANGRVNGLFLGDNQLTGDIPAELGSLTELEWMFLNQNQLTGEIPAELGNLTNLAHLRLDGNRLTGTIPAELGRLTNLTVLYLSGNPLTGCVPASLRDVEDTDFAQLGLTFCTSTIDVDIAEDLSIAGDAAVSDYAEDQADTTVATYTVSGDNVATAMWSLPTGDPDGDGPLVADQTRDKDFFKLEGTGQERVLKFKAAPNFEMPRGQAVSATNTNVYMVTLQVRHDDEDIAFRPVTVTVTDVDELGMLSGDDSFSYAEGGTDAVGTYTLTAIEDGPTVTWSLDGTDKSDFMLEGTGMSRMLKFSSAPDYENPMGGADDDSNTYMVTVKASAGGEMEMLEVTVEVTNVDEMGTLVLSSTTPSVDAELTATLTDLDGMVSGETWMWSKSMDMTFMDGNETVIANATSMSYTPVAGDATYYLKVTVTYTDGEGSGKMKEEMTAAAVTAGDPLLAEYDPDGDGMIERADMRRAVANFFGPSPTLSRADMRRLVGIYFS